MSLHDSLFVEDAEEDVKSFLENDKRKRVLVFPPVNNYRRFLIHQLVQDQFGDLLHTFSIGQGFDRRTVVCYKSDFLGSIVQVNGTQGTGNFTRKSSCTMGIESQSTPGTSPEHSSQRQRQVKSVPSVEIYVPPALRRAKSEKSPVMQPAPTESPTATIEACSKANRQKRPDRAVYVPRHRRGLPEAEGNNVVTPEPSPPKPARESRVASKRPVDKTPSASKFIEPLTVPTVVQSEQIVHNFVEGTSLESASVPTLDEKMEHEMLVKEVSFVEVRKDKVDEEIENKVEEKESVEKHLEEEYEVEKMEEEDQQQIQQETNGVGLIDLPSPVMTNETRLSEKLCQPEVESSTQEYREFENLNFETKSPISDLDSEASNTASVNDNAIATAAADSSDCVSGKSKETPKKPLVSRVLVISTSSKEELPQSPPMQQETENDKNKEDDRIAPVPMTPPEKKVKKVERPKSKPAVPPTPPVKINRDECDWESLFDDNGDCLDPTLIEELTSSVGEVVIEKPKSTYKAFTRPVEVSSDEFGHVLEIYNFPSDFKTSDLAAVFSPFKTQGFELKWVDDTHCLAVFSSPLVAAEVLASDHPFVKTRPLSEATALSKTKARRSSEFLQPFRTRPETCAALARRLVTKSLGVTLATARQEREQEKIVLREAKEKRRLANKQRQEIWDGIVAPKPTI